MFQILVNNAIIEIPDTLHEITLMQRINLQKEHGDILEQMHSSIITLPAFERSLENVLFHVEQSLRAFSFFTGVELEVLRDSNFLDEIVTIFFNVIEPLLINNVDEIKEQYLFNNEIYVLPEPDLKQGCKMTFGELIDSKQAVKEAIENKKNKWEYLLPLCAIFLRKQDEPYKESFMYKNSERLTLMSTAPIEAALGTGLFFDKFSEFCSKHFPVFFPTKGKKPGANIKRHFDTWGWVNFLKEIANTHVFDIPGSGKNSIQCARETSAFDVLLYASESKEFNEATNLDLELLINK